MRTISLLIVRYDGLPIIPAALVCKDYFPHLSIDKFLRKISDGNLSLPLVRIEDSQKSAKGVHIQDLANYIDDQREKALRENKQMYG